MSTENLMNICERMRYQYAPAGDILFKAGAMGETFYIILSGTVSVNVPIKMCKHFHFEGDKIVALNDVQMDSKKIASFVDTQGR